MISIIICSRSSVLNEGLAANIKSTIGVAHEIIAIDNSANQHSICAAYNIGIKRSQYNILCFMHDDILYHTNNWGHALSNHFAQENIGAVGIAGTPFYPYMPGPWWSNGIIYEHILQSGDATTNEPTLKSNIPADQKLRVVAIDGVWLCIRKDHFSKIKFDEINFKGFHLYDSDICMQLYNEGIEIYCIGDILIQHKSMGALNEAWLESDLIFQKKWNKMLPVSCIKMNYNQLCRYEYKTLNAFIWICFGNNWSNKKTYRLALKYLLKFKKGYTFYKTPGYLLKFTYKFLFKKGEPFYS